ncbi:MULTISPECIES: hypothetical protein [unclassified Streptomyces]|uniref:hypothetical protein n=1 Tax=unclassified Streptomyces TaxID=2593676 RepID=UPI0021D44444|nr:MULTISPECIES: hypothetical protein [unclassified Streptomyces]
MRAAIAETASCLPGMDERVEAKLPALREMAADYSKVHEFTHHALLYGLSETASTADSPAERGATEVDGRAVRAWLAAPSRSPVR